MSCSNVEGVYEKIDDYLYEPMDDKPVQEQQENTPVVGGSVDDKAITSCPAYENSTSFTATGISVLYLTLIIDVTLSYPPYSLLLVSSHDQGEGEEQKDDEYENV